MQVVPFYTPSCSCLVLNPHFSPLRCYKGVRWICWSRSSLHELKFPGLKNRKKCSEFRQVSGEAPGESFPESTQNPSSEKQKGLHWGSPSPHPSTRPAPSPAPSTPNLSFPPLPLFLFFPLPLFLFFPLLPGRTVQRLMVLFYMNHW